MNPATVNDRLDQARSCDEIVAAVRAFVAEMTADELEGLPRSHRPTEIGDRVAVVRWALQLSKNVAAANQDSTNRELGERVRDYFAHAARRLATFPQGRAT